MTEPEIEIFHQMLLRCDDIAGKLDYFDVDESLWQHSPYIRDSFLISVSQIGELVSKNQSRDVPPVFSRYRMAAN